MSIYIPQRIFDYKINGSSQTDELVTLRRLLSEIGGYASTILRRDYLSLAKKCSALLRKIEKELNRRDATDPLAEAEMLPGGEIFYSDLESLSISQLECLFRMHPQRVKARLADGREHLTRYFETRIVDELRKRKPAGIAEQMKIDYCLITHKAEMENLCNLLSPFYTDLENFLSSGLCEKFPVSRSREASLWSARSSTVQKQSFCISRESLVEAVDLAIDRLDAAVSLQPLAGVAAHLVELNRKKIVRSPERIADYLLEAIRQWKKRPEVDDTEMVEPLLVAAYLTKDWSLERKAQRIIRRCYRHCLESLNELQIEEKPLEGLIDVNRGCKPVEDRNAERGELRSKSRESRDKSLGNREKSREKSREFRAESEEDRSEKSIEYLFRCLHISESFSSYIDRYSPRKIATCHHLLTPTESSTFVLVNR